MNHNQPSSPAICTKDPLQNPAFKSPGFAEKLRAVFLGARRPLDCVQVEVTSFCSGKCLYCPHTTMGDSWKSRHMSAETFASLWPLLRRSSRAHLQGWGEPLLHPRFFDFAALARKAGCEISTTSCGLVMNDDIADKIISSGMDMIAFSLAGTDGKSNDARNNVDFEKVCANIKFLRAKIREFAARNGPGSGPEIHIAYLLLADRMEAVATLADLMDRLDVQAAIISTLDYLALPQHSELAFRPGERAKIESARVLLERAGEQASSAGRVLYWALPGEEAVATSGGCRENIARSLYVDAEGNISPCVYLNVPGAKTENCRVFGNSRQKDPWLTWSDEEFASFRGALLANRPNTACRDCPKRFEISY